MIFSEYGDSLLVVQFREFYREVLSLKQTLRARHAEVAGSDTLIDPAERSFIDTISERLRTILDRQQRAAVQLGGEFWATYEEARYIMVALADEIFLYEEWDGRSDWNFNLLESRLFQSHIAGELIFQRIESRLTKRDPNSVELGKIYLMALSLGFQGKYRGIASAQLANYRSRLYAFIFNDELASASTNSQLFAAPYQYTVSEEGVLRRLPPARMWIMMLLGLLAVVFGVSHILWRFLTSDLRHVISQIVG